MINCSLQKLRQVLSGVVLLFVAVTAKGVDLELFEFSDSNGTELSGALNSVTSHMWTTSETQGVSDMLPSNVQSGSYRVIKDFDGLAENWLQIDDVTTGKVYLVARMSNWAFRQGLPEDPSEEIRFGFLNDDTGTSGNTVTAEMQIRRNDDGAMEMFGRALGPGASLISDTAPLATDQTVPFTAVLEADFDTDTYKVFYKDGSNPSQVLGQGAMASTRAANSVRFAANNNFGSTNFFPTVIDEQFNIDRIAVSDTNPLTDLVEVVIDRDDATITLLNNTGVALSNLESIEIASANGSLNVSGWKSVAGNYDNSGTGNGLVDSDGTWSVVTSTPSLLEEVSDGGNGGALGVGAVVPLSLGINENGAWLQSPFEDVTVTLNFSGGVARTANVAFEGNGGSRFPLGDFDFNGEITVNDWTILLANGEADLGGLSRVQAYQLGDLSGDNANNIIDVGLFKEAFDFNNGAGAFAAMISQIPEPNTKVLLLLGIVTAVLGWRYQRPLRSIAAVLVICFLSACLAPSAEAVILEDFPFSDVSGATLGEVDNVANPGNSWTEETSVMTESAVANPPGVFRVQKANDDFGRNYLDIENITSGQAWLVAEMAGWNYSSIVGSPDFDSGQLEEIRFNFLDNDGADIGGSTVTAAARIERTGAGGLQIRGLALGTGTSIAATPLSLNQTDPFTVVLELDKDEDTYQIFIKDGNSPFTSIGSGNVDPGREGNSLRLGFNNNFSGTGEFFDLDRLYLTDESPIVDAVDPLTLKVNLTSGQTWIANDSTIAYEIDSYRITDDNPVGALSTTGWSSLSDRSVDAVDGPDGDLIVGNGIGETWDEAGGSNPKALSESFLFGSSMIMPTEQLSLGQAVTPGSSPDLGFEFRRADTGAIIPGLIEFVTGGGVLGDFNGDNVVDLADYTVWRDNLGAADDSIISDNGDQVSGVTQADYVVWKQNFGSPGSAAGSVAASATVPEPRALLLGGLAMFLFCGRAWRSSL